MNGAGNLVAKVLNDEKSRAKADELMKKAYDRASCAVIEHRAALLALADRVQARAGEYAEAESRQAGKPIRLTTGFDVPGSIEFQHDALSALAVCDAAVVVCEPSPDRVVALTPLLKYIEDHHIPHVLFINKKEAAITKMLGTLQVEVRPESDA